MVHTFRNNPKVLIHPSNIVKWINEAIWVKKNLCWFLNKIKMFDNKIVNEYAYYDPSLINNAIIEKQVAEELVE